jgi:rod shape-determining protein MreC
MESLLYRYRNITVLLMALFAQLILVAWQVKNDDNVPLVRIWAITAVTPVASTIENVRNGTTGFFGTWFALRDARDQSRRLQTEVNRLRIENQLLHNELASAQRAEAMAGFQAHTPSKMVGARVIGTTSGGSSQTLLIDRGSASGVRRGMAVVTPSGVVGRILAVYPFASQVLSLSDPGFAAGVESQKNHVHGVLKGLGNGATRVDYIPAGQKVEVGELFFTSGEDRVFPKGMVAGKVTGIAEGPSYQDITVEPTGTEAAPEEVLIVVDPVHQEIPEAPPAETPVFLAPDVPPAASEPGGAPANVSQYSARPTTQADKMMDQYRKIGEAQGHVFGEGLPGSKPPDFNINPNAPAAGAKPPLPGAPAGGAQPAALAPKPANATPPGGAAPLVAPPKPVSAGVVPGTVTPAIAAPKPAGAAPPQPGAATPNAATTPAQRPATPVTQPATAAPKPAGATTQQPGSATPNATTTPVQRPATPVTQPPTAAPKPAGAAPQQSDSAAPGVTTTPLQRPAIPAPPPATAAPKPPAPKPVPAPADSPQ